MVGEGHWPLWELMSSFPSHPRGSSSGFPVDLPALCTAALAGVMSLPAPSPSRTIAAMRTGRGMHCGSRFDRERSSTSVGPRARCSAVITLARDSSKKGLGSLGTADLALKVDGGGAGKKGLVVGFLCRAAAIHVCNRRPARRMGGARGVRGACREAVQGAHVGMRGVGFGASL